jgi:hypothetical protein
MNMSEEQNSKLFFLGIFPKCSFYKSIQAMLIIIALIAIGTVGIYFLNLWAAVGYLAYSIGYYFLAMPLTLCKYCYFKTTETTIDRDTGETIVQRLPLDKWRESYCQKHIEQGKRWTWTMSIVWLLPIVLIVISFFLSFSIYALISLIGFIVVLVGNFFYMIKKKCPSCPIVDDCQAGFGNKKNKKMENKVK